MHVLWEFIVIWFKFISNRDFNRENLSSLSAALTYVMNLFRFHERNENIHTKTTPTE